MLSGQLRYAKALKQSIKNTNLAESAFQAGRKIFTEAKLKSTYIFALLTTVASIIALNQDVLAQTNRLSSRESAKPIAPKATDPLESFEAVVEKYKQFFLVQRIAIFGVKQTSTPTEIFALARYNGTVKSYDVKKTDSLVSPFTAVIDMQMRRSQSPYKDTDCGDLKSSGDTGSNGWWSSAELAISAQNRESCFAEVFDLLYRFHLAYQKNTWVLKDVSLPDNRNSQEKMIGGIFELVDATVPVMAANHVNSINKSWKALLN